MLITGPWSQLSGRYSCVFDQSTVAASLIQPGVLRCYCPGTPPTHSLSLHLSSTSLFHQFVPAVTLRMTVCSDRVL